MSLHDALLAKAFGGGSGGTGGGGTSIDVTAEVGQTIIVKEVDASGKPTKWESADYQPRTHWTDVVEILPETTAEVDAESGAVEFPQIALEAGADYTVIYNGTEYVCTCVNGVFLGNVGALGFDETMVDTGEPFAVINENGVFAFIPLDGSTSVTLSIERRVCTHIPGEYLGNAVYYIDVTTAEDGTLSIAETAAELFAVIKSGRVMIARRSARDDTNGYVQTVHIPFYSQFVYDTRAVSLIFLIRISNTSSGVVINIAADRTVSVSDNLD